MKPGSPHDPSLDDDVRLDENDPLWQLLGRAPLPRPEGWFTARTLARCRREVPLAKAASGSLVRAWRWALGGGLGLSLAVVLVMAQTHAEKAAKQQNVQEAFEIMASVDTDSDSSPSSSSSWQDSSL